MILHLNRNTNIFYIEVYLEKGSVVIDSLLNNQIGFTDIFEPTFISESHGEKKRFKKIQKLNPIVFEFIIYTSDNEIICVGNNDLKLYFLQHNLDEYLLNIIEKLDIIEVYFFMEIGNYYGLSKEGKLYKIYTIEKKVVCYD